MSSLNNQLRADLAAIEQAGLRRTLPSIQSPQGVRVRIGDRELLNFASNDYLGLANHPRLREAVVTAVDQYGTGAGASRLVTGNLHPYHLLETELARFKEKEAAIVFGSGYAANLGTISALVGKGDLVILDKLDHASIVDGARLSGATIRVYPHRDLNKLERILAAKPDGKRTLIITETVFSMDGDLAPLEDLVHLKDRYGAWLMIDEAHATGMYGRHGRGLAELRGVASRVEITLGTLSKALGAAGGFVCGSQLLVDYLCNRARSLIYSTALPPAVCAAATEAVRLAGGPDGACRRKRLWHNLQRLHRGLAARGWLTEAHSPILPLLTGDETAAVELSRHLRDRGVFVPAIRYPTVARGKARLRLTVSAAHTADDIDALLEALGDHR